MAAPVVAVVAKKVAAIILTDKRTWTVIGSVIGAIVAFIVIAVTVIFGGISAHNTAKEEANTAMRTGLKTLFADGELPDNLPAEYRDGIIGIKGMMTSIEDEIENQGLGTDPLKAQMIALCLLTKRIYDENFYTDYISCFAGEENDNAIFDAVAAKFGIEISADDRAKILQLYEQAVAYTTVPPGSIHNEIAELVNAAPAVTATDDPIQTPIRVDNWKSLITSKYGYRTDPVTGEENVGHAGIDIGLPTGTDIYAAKAGIVLFARTGSEGYGNFLAVNHGGGVVTLYAHCSELLVSAGEEVTAETVISRSGNSGKSTAPHLHFEVVVDDKPINPIKYFK